jgi:hypothetical protein
MIAASGRSRFRCGHAQVHLPVETVDGDDGALGGLQQPLYAPVRRARSRAVEAGLELKQHDVELGDLAGDALDFLVALASHEGRGVESQQRHRQALDLDVVAGSAQMDQES